MPKLSKAFFLVREVRKTVDFDDLAQRDAVRRNHSKLVDYNKKPAVVYSGGDIVPVCGIG